MSFTIPFIQNLILNYTKDKIINSSKRTHIQHFHTISFVIIFILSNNNKTYLYSKAIALQHNISNTLNLKKP
jgi:hypothetical protein